MYRHAVILSHEYQCALGHDNVVVSVFENAGSANLTIILSVM